MAVAGSGVDGGAVDGAESPGVGVGAEGECEEAEVFGVAEDRAGLGGAEPVEVLASGAGHEGPDAVRVAVSGGVHRVEAFVVVLVSGQGEVAVVTQGDPPERCDHLGAPVSAAGGVPRLVGGDQAAWSGVGRHVPVQPSCLGVAVQAAAPGVERVDPPPRDVVGVVTGVLGCLVPEVPVVGPGPLGLVLVVAGDRSGDGLQSTPGPVIDPRAVQRVEAVLEVAEDEDNLGFEAFGESAGIGHLALGRGDPFTGRARDVADRDHRGSAHPRRGAGAPPAPPGGPPPPAGPPAGARRPAPPPPAPPPDTAETTTSPATVATRRRTTRVMSGRQSQPHARHPVEGQGQARFAATSRTTPCLPPRTDPCGTRATDSGHPLTRPPTNRPPVQSTKTPAWHRRTRPRRRCPDRAVEGADRGSMSAVDNGSILFTLIDRTGEGHDMLWIITAVVVVALVALAWWRSGKAKPRSDASNRSLSSAEMEARMRVDQHRNSNPPGAGGYSGSGN